MLTFPSSAHPAPLEATVLHSPLPLAAPLTLAAVAIKIVINCFGLAGFVALVLVLAFLAEPGPQVSSFGPAARQSVTIAHADPIGALIREGR
jgi:hypothetical protein